VSKTYKIDEFVTNVEQIAQVAYKLLDSIVYLEHSTLILSHIVTQHALASKNIDELTITYSILYFAGKEDSRYMMFISTEACHLQHNRLKYYPNANHLQVNINSCIFH
jgi:hypothetical protein